MLLDAEFLSEVEGFLDLCDLATLSPPHNAEKYSEGSSLPNGDADTSNGDKQIVTNTEHVRHQVYRKRRRAEREMLEQEAEELEKQLSKEPKRLLSMSGWRMVAACHLESRLVSEKQQRQLRAALAAQTTLIQMYQGLIRGEVIQALHTKGEDAAHYKPSMLQLESCDTEFYKTSEKTFNTIYAQTDAVLNSFRLDTTDSNCGTTTQELRGENGMTYFRYTDKRVIPSTFEVSCNTLKHTLRRHQEKDQRIYDGMEDPDKTVAIKFRVATQLQTGQVVSVLLRGINRRYREEHRVVGVWRVFAEGEGAFAGMHADEIGWGVITPSTASENNSLLRFCARYVPMSFSKTATSKPDPAAEKFVGTVMDASACNSDQIASALENLVLSDNYIYRC